MDSYIRTKIKRSLIQKYFSKELYLDLYKITMMSRLNNNQKGILVKRKLTEYNVPWSAVGPGTNRVCVMIDGYAVKFALDKDGMVDNRREFLYSKEIQPHVIKVYECIPNGLIAVSEYVSVFSIDDMHRYQKEMREILSTINDAGFLIGDVGITAKNYTNWGIKNDGAICMLDFAYIYTVNFGVFKCSCDEETLMEYNKDFVQLICPHCGKKYDFDDVRQKITRVEQEKEIGDIRRMSYNLTKSIQEVELVEGFEPPKPKKKGKKMSETKALIKKYEEEKEKLQYMDYWEYSGK